LRVTVAPAAGGASIAGFQHTAMLEGMLLMLLALGGGNGSPAAAMPSQTGPDPVVGIWRGTWTTQGPADPVPVEAIVTPPSKEGQLLALVATGVGRLRHITRGARQADRGGVRLLTAP